MSYQYKCTRCNAVIGDEMTTSPHCNTCRLESAMSGLFSNLSSSRSYQDETMDRLKEIFRTSLTWHGLPR